MATLSQAAREPGRPDIQMVVFYTPLCSVSIISVIFGNSEVTSFYLTSVFSHVSLAHVLWVILGIKAFKPLVCRTQEEM